MRVGNKQNAALNGERGKHAKGCNRFTSKLRRKEGKTIIQSELMDELIVECKCTGPWDCQCDDVMRDYYYGAKLSNRDIIEKLELAIYHYKNGDSYSGSNLIEEAIVALEADDFRI